MIRRDESGRIVDMAEIRRRVFGRDTVFSQRVVLTALIKGGHDVQGKILARLGPEDWTFFWFRLVFDAAVEMLRSKGRVDTDGLYESMRAHVYRNWPSSLDPQRDAAEYSAEEVMPGYTGIIDHLLELEMPDEDLLDVAIAQVQQASARMRAFRRDQATKLGEELE